MIPTHSKLCAPGWVNVSLLAALAAFALAAPAPAAAQSAPPAPDDQLQDPYAGQVEDPYGAPSEAPAPAPAPEAAKEPAPAPAAEPAPAPAAEPATDIEEAVARALYQRARELHAQGDHVHAKMLLVESLERSPGGAVSGGARELLALCEERIGSLPALDHESDVTLDPFAIREHEDTLNPFAVRARAGDREMPEGGRGSAGPEDTVDEEDRWPAQRTLIIYGGLYGFTAGMAVAGLGSDDEPVMGGLLGAGAGLGAAYLASRYAELSAAQASIVAWTSAWTGMAASVVVDLTAIDTNTATEIARGAAVGGAVGAGAGWFLARQLDEVSTGDVALVSSLGLYGTAISLFLGLAMDPAESEAYSINALIGAAAGIGLGLYAAPRLEVDRGRLLWVDLGAAVGAAAPWLLLYPAIEDSSTRADEQTMGVISALGLVAGGYLVWRMTADREVDTSDIGRKSFAAVPGLIQRDAAGAWGLGMPLVRAPENPALGPRGQGWGLAVDVLGGQF